MIKTTFTASISALVAFTSIESSNAYPLSEAGHVPEHHVTEPTHDTAAVSTDPPTHPDLVYKSYEPDLERDHVKLVLTNDSNQKVEVYWHDYHGTKQYYYTLNPGASVTQETYVHHPWSVVGQTNADAPLTVDGFGVFIPVSADNGRTVSIAETTFNHSNPCADGCNVMPPQQTYYGATGTEYFNGNWVTAYSHNSFKEVNYTGECKENAFDYFDDGCLVNNKVVDETKCWKERDFYCFETRFNDESKTIQILVNKSDFPETTAKVAGPVYAKLLGVLPRLLRKDLKNIVVHSKDGYINAKPAQGQIIYYTDTVEEGKLIENGHMEEVMIHEATHVSLDPLFESYYGGAKAEEWKKAVEADGKFLLSSIGYIADYAKSYGEDVAETFLVWLVTRQNKAAFTSQEIFNLNAAMHNRFTVFDKLCSPEMSPYNFYCVN